MNVVLFEDAAVEQLYPITLTRPAFAVTCGGLRLIDLAYKLGTTVDGVVRPHLKAFLPDYLPRRDLQAATPTLWLNARLIPDAMYVSRLRNACAESGSWCVMQAGNVVAARTEAGLGPNLGASDQSTVLDFLACQLPTRRLDLGLLEFPHNLLAEHLQIMSHNLEYLVEHGDYCEIAEGVFAPNGARLPDHVVFETQGGPIILGDRVTIGPFTVVRGPTRFASDVLVAPQSFVKGCVAVGQMAKLGGELSGAIIEPYSNKMHYGYLGTSYVGSWVNLGAGTTNSNLKNTYGTIRMHYGDRKVDSGMQFMGCVIGDYSKTAIHTSIYTGKIIGACSNVYGTVTTNVPSFANYARSLGDVTEHPPEVMEITQKRVFQRRDKTQEPRHIALIRDIYEIEAPKRNLANSPPSL